MFKITLKNGAFLLVLKRKVPAIEIIARVRKETDEHPFLIAHYKNNELKGGMTCSGFEMNRILDCIQPVDIQDWEYCYTVANL